MKTVKSTDLPPAILRFQELMCGCGNPELCWDWLLNYLEKVVAKQTKQFDNEVGTEYLAVYIVDTQCKMTNHGGSILHSWLTVDGQNALNWLRKNTAEYAADMVITYS